MSDSRHPAPFKKRRDEVVAKDVSKGEVAKHQQEIPVLLYGAIGLGAFAVGEAVWAVIAIGHNLSDAFIAGGTVVTAIATAIVANYTNKLMIATEAIKAGGDHALGHQRNATERDQRAYVMYDRCAKGDAAELIMVFRNFGRTPARNVQVAGHVSFAPPNSFGPVLAHNYAAERSRINMAPGGEHWVAFKRSRRSLEQKAAMVLYPAMYNGATTEYLHGRIEYSDAFGCRRYTWFRYWIDSDNHPQNCSDGNDWS